MSGKISPHMPKISPLRHNHDLSDSKPLPWIYGKLKIHPHVLPLGAANFLTPLLITLTPLAEHRVSLPMCDRWMADWVSVRVCVWEGVGVWIEVGQPCPPIRDNIVTPRHLLSFLSRVFTPLCPSVGYSVGWIVDTLYLPYYLDVNGRFFSLIILPKCMIGFF